MGSDTALRVEFKNPEKVHCPPLVTPPRGGGVLKSTHIILIIVLSFFFSLSYQFCLVAGGNTTHMASMYRVVKEHNLFCATSETAFFLITVSVQLRENKKVPK